MQWVKNKQKIDRGDWHLWFAWYPVPVDTYNDGNIKYVWGERVLRRSVLKDGRMNVGVVPIWVLEYKERPVHVNLPKVKLTPPMPEVREPAVSSVPDKPTPPPPPEPEVRTPEIHDFDNNIEDIWGFEDD